MLTNETAGIAAGAAGLCTEAGSIYGIALRQLGAVENFFAMIVGSRNFTGGNDVLVEAFQLEHILSELRQLAGTNHAVTGNDYRSQHFGVALLLSVKIHHEVDAGTLKAGTEALVEGEAGTGNFGGTLSIEDVQLSTDIPVVLRLEIKLTRLAPALTLRVVVFIDTDGNILSRHIGDAEKDFTKVAFYLLQFLIESGNLVAYGSHICYQLIGILAVALHLTDLLGDCVALALQRFYLTDNTAAALLQSGKAVKLQRVVAVFQHCADSIKIFTDKFQV